VWCRYHVITAHSLETAPTCTSASNFWRLKCNQVSEKHCISSLIQHQLFPFRHNLSENKKFGHHPHTMGYVCANLHISTVWFLQQCMEKNVLFLVFFTFFPSNFAMVKNFKRIIPILDATFVPNLAFLGLLRYCLEKNWSPTHPLLISRSVNLSAVHCGISYY